MIKTPGNQPAGAGTRYMNPFNTGRSFELKQQFVGAAIEGMEAVWSVQPRASIVQIDPIIHVHANPDLPGDAREASAFNEAQFQARDMLTGRFQPELGGDMTYLDIVGLNYYSNNRWVRLGPTVGRDEPAYLDLRHLLVGL